MASQSFIIFDLDLGTKVDKYFRKLKKLFLLNSPGFDIREENDANELKNEILNFYTMFNTFLKP